MITRSRGKNDASERNHLFAAHRLADDRESLLAYRLVGANIIGAVKIALVDLAAGDDESISIMWLLSTSIDSISSSSINR
jgi:hypothetical protein